MSNGYYPHKSVARLVLESILLAVVFIRKERCG